MQQQMSLRRCSSTMQRCLGHSTRPGGPPCAILPARTASSRRTLCLRLAALKGSNKAVQNKAEAWGVRKKGSTPQPDDEEPEGWRFFDASAYNEPWDVPWGGKTVAGGMAAWILSFALVAFVGMPSLWTAVTGQPLFELGPQGQAQFSVASEVAEAVVTLGLLKALTAKHSDELEPRGLFNYSLAQPFKKGRGWLVWGLLGVVLSPLVVGATAYALTAVGYDSVAGGGRGTVDGVASMISMDGPTYVNLITTTGILAPLLEESLFRGFLLTSLTKAMPTWAAVIASSAAFATAHLSIRDAPVLFSLGCFLGFLYVRSRNLLTPMLVHGVWNSAVLSLLFAMTASGVDINTLLKEAR